MAQATDKESVFALDAVVDLFQSLNRHGVRYCHWKSNVRLALSLCGQTDLDLLVDPEHSHEFKRLLEEHQVKYVLAAPGKDYPGIENYLGFDAATGALFHLHVHYQLVLGEQFVKNYHLPLEDAFLDSVRLHHGVNIPAPELELIVLSLRALLKYRDRDALKDALSIRSPGIPSHILDEIRWLLGQTTLQDVSNVLAELPGVIREDIREDIVLDFLQTVVASPRDGRALYRLRQRVRRALRPYQRHDRLRAAVNYFRELSRRRSFLRFEPGKKMTLPAGGITAALVGVDGAGKTTMCQELTRWLSWKLDTRLYYMGSKQPSWLSKRLYLLFRIARRGQRVYSGWFGELNAISRLLAAVRQMLLYSHYLSVAFDRYRRYQLSRRYAARGSIVVYDRFPLIARLDGPQIHQIADGNRGAIVRAFAEKEQGLYRKFQMPDLLVVLTVSPETSLRRKPDHRRDAIEAKTLALNKLRAEGETTFVKGNWIPVNADLPLEDVLRHLKRVIWEAL